MKHYNYGRATIAFLVGAFIWALFFHKDTYEGQTAEEWFYAYDTATAQQAQCETKFAVVDEELLELGKCVENNKNFYREVIQSCQQSGKFTQEQCLTVALKLVDGYNEGLRECVATYSD